jgi:hypothetical protein
MPHDLLEEIASKLDREAAAKAARKKSSDPAKAPPRREAPRAIRRKPSAGAGVDGKALIDRPRRFAETVIEQPHGITQREEMATWML